MMSAADQTQPLQYTGAMKAAVVAQTMAKKTGAGTDVTREQHLLSETTQTQLFASDHHLHLVRLSPDGKLIVSIQKQRLVIRDSLSMQVVNMFPLVSPVMRSTDIQWSPDSKRIAVLFVSSNHLIVFGVAEETPIDELRGGEVEEIAQFLWCPSRESDDQDGTKSSPSSSSSSSSSCDQILTLSRFSLSLSCWSISSQFLTYLPVPKSLFHS